MMSNNLPINNDSSASKESFLDFKLKSDTPLSKQIRQSLRNNRSRSSMIYSKNTGLSRQQAQKTLPLKT